MSSRILVAVLLSLTCDSPAAAYSIKPGGPKPSPKNWLEISADGRFVFVMREPDGVGPAVEFPAGSDEAIAREFPTSGLYRTHNRERVWATDVVLERRRDYCHHHVRVLDDGVHVVWLYHAPHGPSKIPPKQSWWGGNGNQIFYSLGGPGGNFSVEGKLIGVKLLAAGKLVGAFTPDELVRDASRLEDHGFGHRPWIATAEVIRNELTLETLDDQRLTFDLDTGELIGRESTAQFKWQPLAIAGGTVLFLLAAAALLLLRPARPAAPATEAVE